MATVIIDGYGTLLEFIHDQILAIWNAPNDVEEYACVALEQALLVTPPRSPPPHRRRDWAHPSHIGTGTGPDPATSAPGLGPTPPTSAPGLGSPLPHLRRTWLAPAPIGTGTGLTPAHNGTGTGPTPAHIGTGTGLTPAHFGTGTGLTPAHIGTGTRLTPAPIGTGTGLTPAHICTGTGLTPAHNGTGLTAPRRLQMHEEFDKLAALWYADSDKVRLMRGRAHADADVSLCARACGCTTHSSPKHGRPLGSGRCACCAAPCGAAVGTNACDAGSRRSRSSAPCTARTSSSGTSALPRG
jgi:hypothetical protein